jgi:hypothetical protein
MTAYGGVSARIFPNLRSKHEMSVKPYDFAPEAADSDNWAVAKRMVSAFSPQAQSSPDMTVFLNKGWLLNNTAVIEVAPQTVGPFAVPTVVRADRIVVNRADGAAMVVAGTEGVTTPPAVPSGCLPVARVVLTAGMSEITNEALYDERVFADQTPTLTANLTALSGLDAAAGLVEQTGPATFTKRTLGAAAASDVPTRGDADARYLQLSGGTLTGALTLAGDPTAALHPAGKQYVDTLVAGAVADLASENITVTGAGILTGGGDLTADRVISAADVAQNTVLGRTAAGVGAPSAISTPMIAVATAADAAASRGVLGLGDAALRGVGTASAADLPTLGDADARYLQLSGGTLTGPVTMTGVLTLAGDPTAALHPASKQYVDNLAAGLDVKPSVKAAGTGDLALSGEQNVDSVALATGDRVLVKNQNAPAENGVYVVAAGAWSRSADMDAWIKLPGAFVFVEQGAVNADSGWVCAADAGGALGTDAVVWSQFAGVGAFVPLSRQVTAGAGLTGGGDLSADRALSLADTAVTAGAYGSSSRVATFTVDQKGRLTAAVEADITPAAIGAQAQDADLDALAGVSSAGLLARTGAGVAATRSVQGSGVVSVADGDGVAGDPTVSIAMQSGKLLGRSTAGDGAAEQITLGAGLSLSGGALNVTAQGAEISQSGPTYLASGGSVGLTGKTVLAAYEQIAGQTFNLTYNTEADYAQQDATNGTDISSGAFVLHNAAGSGAADSATKLLIHADGVNGSTEIVDQRGITPFGTHCAYFDGTAYFTVPQSYKTAFGASQDFTKEFWLLLPDTSSCWIMDDRSSGADNSADRFSVTVVSGLMRVNVGGTARVTETFSANAWRHVAVVRYAGTLRLYVDGVSTSSWADTTAYDAKGLCIGGDISGSARFTGWMDELRVSKVARYTANFTPHTTPHVRDADTVYLFHFDDGHGSQVLKDDSRSGAGDLYLNGVSISTTQAKFGSSSLRFPGGNNYLQTQGNKYLADHAIGADDFTIDFWVRLDAISGTQSVFRGSIPAGYNPIITVNGSGQALLYLSSNGTSSNLANGAAFGTLSATTWTHIALTRSGTNVYAFVNGVLGATVAVGTSTVWPSTAYYNMGRTDGTSYLTGYVDELRVKRGVAEWTATFTPPTAPYVADDHTILLLHFEGANGDKVTLDSSESSYGTAQISAATIPVLTFVAGSLSSGQTRGGHATSLQCSASSNAAVIGYGSNDLVDGNPWRLFSNTKEHCCIELWYYDGGGSLTGELIHIMDQTAGSTRFSIKKGGSAGVLTAGPITNVPITQNAWNHVALVRDAVGTKFYINGELKSTYNSTWSVPWVTGNVHNVEIGGGNGGNFIGSNHYIDAIRITTGKPRYTANFTPGNLTQDDDTALLWEFNGSVGQKWVKELSKNATMIASTNARTVSDGVWLAPSNAPVSNSTGGYKFGSASLYGTGSTYYQSSVPVLPAFAGDFTVDFWANTSTGVGSQGPIIDTRNSSSQGGMVIYVGAADMRFVYTDPAGTDVIDSGAVSTANGSGAFVHWAFVRSGTTLTAYRNGTSVYSVTHSAGMPAGWLTLFARRDLVVKFTGYIDEFRISDTARWTANFTPPSIPYGESYVAGPYWVATKPGVSALDLSAFSSIDNAALTASTPPGTALKFLVSTDAYASALKRWTGSAWADTAYSMTWNGTTLSTAATSAQLDAVGNTAAELQTGLAALDASALSSLNVVALLSSSNASYTPSLDNLAVTTDAYALLRPVTDYTVSRKKATGEQTLTVTRVKSGSAAHVFDVV